MRQERGKHADHRYGLLCFGLIHCVCLCVARHRSHRITYRKNYSSMIWENDIVHAGLIAWSFGGTDLMLTWLSFHTQRNFNSKFTTMKEINNFLAVYDCDHRSMTCQIWQQTYFSLLNSNTIYCSIIFANDTESTTFIKCLYKVK
jgi:hypothetical protein